MTSFSQHCHNVVKEYIHTVMIIDDGAGLNNEKMEVEAVVNPSAANPFLDNNMPNALMERKPAQEKSKAIHPLDTFSLTNAFFEKGIVAGIYQPIIDDNLAPEDFALKAKSACEKADIIILDWILKDRNSDFSKATVKEILHSDNESGGKIRAIMIYTGESNLNSLRDELWDYLNNDELDKENNYEIRSKNLIISFYNKSHDGYPFAPDRTMKESDIPHAALNSFAILVDGLIPVFAMKSAASIRKHTGRILSRFGKNLDTAYLAHRVLLPDPEDSEVFMLENFVSYMRNILAITRVDNATLGIEPISGWIKENNERLQGKIVNSNEEYKTTLEDMIELSQHGFPKKLYEILECNKKSMSKAYKDTSKQQSLNAISIFDSNELTVTDSSVELSILSSFRRTFKDIVGTNETPYLTQGSLIYSKNKDQFLLCVTPKCDTVRIDKEMRFSFVILNETPGGKFNLVIPSNSFIMQNKIKHKDSVIHKIIDECLLNKGRCLNEMLYGKLESLDKIKNEPYVYLRSQPKFHTLEHIYFESDDKNRVSSNNIKPELIEFWDIDYNEYVWIGDLHDLNTISCVGNLVTNLNRTGTDEVEWLRRQYQ